MTQPRDLVTVIEVDLWTGSATQTLRLSDVGPVIGTQADPRLYVPIEIGSHIIADKYGDVLRSAGSNGGAFDFTLGRSRVGPSSKLMDPEIWALLALHWQGRPVRVYAGERGAHFEDFDLVYTGRADDLRHDTLRASTKIGDASVDLNDVLVSDLYPKDDGTIPEALQGRPKPELRGAADNIAPVLLTDTNFGAPLTFQVSRLPLDDITEVRVGGIPWARVAINPVAGQWSADLPNGKFTIGGITGGLEVRVDARGIGWATMTTARLLTDLVTEAGGTVDEAAMAALDVAAPSLIGWYTGTDERNRLDAFDEIMTSVVGWWCANIDGTIAAGVLDDPAAVADLSLSGIEIADLQMSGLLPPAWRIRVEHSRNRSPLSSFADAVTEADKQRWEQPGIIAAAWEDAAIKTDEPRAIDLPVIRSLVRTEADALAIRDRAARVFGVSRRLYQASAWVDTPDLYSTASLDYLMVSAGFRVHGVVRSFGGGPTTLQLWG